jgi:hypothetical protein
LLKEKNFLKAIMMILEQEPPTLSRNEGWDESFIEMIEYCLQKEQDKRKDARELLKCKFL